jgi:hypothetical protein
VAASAAYVGGEKIMITSSLNVLWRNLFGAALEIFSG